LTCEDWQARIVHLAGGEMSEEKLPEVPRVDPPSWTPAETPGPKMVVPIRDRLLVKRRAQEEKIGLLEIPEQYRDVPNEGVVVAIGDGRMLQNGVVTPMAVKPGDRVLFGRFCGTDIMLNGDTFLMLREDDVVAAIRDADPSMRERTTLLFTRETLSVEDEGESEEGGDEEEE
jgi:chaperonin GroES